MGYKGFKITTDLIEQFLAKGARHKLDIEIEDGPLPDAKIVRVDFDVINPWVTIWYSHPEYTSFPRDGGSIIVKRYYEPG